MATKKTAATKVVATDAPDLEVQEDDGQNCPMPSPPPAPEDVPVVDEPIDEPEDVPAAGAPAAAAPAAAPGAVKSSLPSSITIAVGEAGYYTGARPVETKAAYDARMGASANTFADLGWILGTKPQV